ncbi:MAG: hypothetical protein IJY28_04535 [Clostridia bacterium]|nr:hypothetical protein [Clostridia bacterium]
MAWFTTRTDELAQAISGRLQQVTFNNCVGVNVEQLFRKALEKDPRMLALLSGYEFNYITSNGIVRDYTILLQYNADAPGDLSDILVDNGSWNAQSLLTKGAPGQVTLVSKNRQAIRQQLNDNLGRLVSLYEGIHGYNMNSGGFPSLTDYELLKISFDYIMPMNQLRQYQAQAQRAARTAWQTILGKAQVPPAIKPFLALSYLTQEAIYDHRCHDEVRSNSAAIPTDPIPHLGYGPLVEKRGICSGLAWAFKHMMDAARIECICVTGYLKSDRSVGHMWNMVKLDNQYYHVDLAVGIDNDGVCVCRMMQPDIVFRSDHEWNTADYPVAYGSRFDYDYVEEYLAEHEIDLLRQGAEEKYLFPERIID